MSRFRVATWLRLLPAVALVGVGAGFALFEGIAASLGIGSPVGDGATNLNAYERVLSTPGFWESATFSLGVAVVSTLIAVTGATAVVWFWVTRVGKVHTIDLWLTQVQLSLPHVAWAVALVATLSQSGWISRVVAATGLIDRPDQFPVIVGDRWGLGIIIHIATKEMAFIALVVLPIAVRRAPAMLTMAATLGASKWQRFFMTFLPAIAPALVPATVVVFAFGLGSYEPAAILGSQRPRTLAVIARELFSDPDLSRRADAFALSTMLVMVIALGALALWMPTRRWLSPHHESSS